MTAAIVIDIETIPRPASQNELDAWRKKWKAPSNYKDPDKIAAKKDEDESKWLDKRKFNPSGAKMISIAACVVGKTGELLNHEVASGDDGTELSTWLREYLSGFADYKLVTYNGRSFDLPIIARTLADSGVRLKRPIGKWGVVDLYEYPFYRAAGGLKYWSGVFGIDFDDSVDGSNVLELYDAGNWAEIERYNLDDVRITAELYYKLTALYEL
jgi:predicted PolB exonuclease-like 3'-5' exonuclease